MNYLNSFKTLPQSTRRLLSLGIILALVIALPLFIWAIVNQKFLIVQHGQEVTRVNVAIDGAPFLGPADAPITIVEFGDFQCPFCKDFHDNTLQPLLDAYPNKIRFVFRNFPLTLIHPQAEIAAEAGLCANEQGKFWQMSDLMFANQDNLVSDNLKALAATIVASPTQFNSCLDATTYSSVIQKDIADGTNYGVNGTPTFFIDGILVSGNQPLSAFQQIIDGELNPTPSPSPTESPTVSSSASPTESPTASPSVTPTATPSNPNDDVFFIPNQTIINFTTTNQNPNVSVNPTELQIGQTYIVDVSFNLQNNLKAGYPNASSAAVLLINNHYLNATQISIPLIAAHLGGAQYTVSGAFTDVSASNNITVTFDPNNTYPETNENNNSLSYNFSPAGASTPQPTATPAATDTPTPTPTIAPTGTPNSCGGTCGSNYNCNGGLFCFNGFCRNPDCREDITCGCAAPTPTVAAKSTLRPKTTPVLKILATVKPTITPTPVSTPGLSTETMPVTKKFDYLTIGVLAALSALALFILFSLFKLFKSKDNPPKINPPANEPTEPIQTYTVTPPVQQNP